MTPETVYEFEWDPSKAAHNASKHGVTFDQAASVFLDAWALTVYDDMNSQSEDRWFTLGYNTAGLLLAVAHTHHIAGPTHCSGAHHLGTQGHEA